MNIIGFNDLNFENEFNEKYPDFDIEFYKNFYKDLENLNNYQLKIHYFFNGVNENRIKCEKEFYDRYPDFDIEFYKNFYKDLKNLNNYELYFHYFFNGVNENRIKCEKEFYDRYPDFDIEFYKNFNTDLNNLSNLELLRHYFFIGVNEERFYNINIIPNNYNPYYYQKINLDIKSYDNFTNKEDLVNIKNNIINNRNINILNDDEFNNIFYDFDINIYKKENKDLQFNDDLIYKKHFFYFGQFERRIYTVKIKIIIVCNQYLFRDGFGSGGDLSLYYLAKKINEMNYNNFYCKLLVYNQININNPYCNNFAHFGDINDNSFLLYSDGMEGNPFLAKKKNIIRWILLELGTTYRPKDFYKTWNNDDLVYHWELNPKFNAELKILNNTYLDKSILDINLNKINESCYLIKKRILYENNITFDFHPTNSICLDNINSNEIINYLSSSKYFYCYDHKTFFIIISIIFNCKTILIPFKNLTKEEYINYSVFNNFKNFNKFFAYGIDDINNINYNNQDINDLILYIDNLSNSIKFFLDDLYKYINNIDVFIPTVKSVYIDSNFDYI